MPRLGPPFQVLKYVENGSKELKVGMLVAVDLVLAEFTKNTQESSDALEFYKRVDNVFGYQDQKSDFITVVAEVVNFHYQITAQPTDRMYLAILSDKARFDQPNRQYLVSYNYYVNKPQNVTIITSWFYMKNVRIVELVDTATALQQAQTDNEMTD